MKIRKVCFREMNIFHDEIENKSPQDRENTDFEEKFNFTFFNFEKLENNDVPYGGSEG